MQELQQKFSLPPELFDRVVSELMPMTDVDMKPLQWGQTLAPDGVFSRSGLEQYREQIDRGVRESHCLAELDKGRQEVVKLEKAANKSQDDVDRILMKYGNQIADRLGKEELRYPGPLPWEKRTALIYTIKENTPLTKQLPNQTRQQLRDFLTTYVRNNEESSVYQRTAEEQHWINELNCKSLLETKLKVNQNDHRNAWRTTVNEGYLKLLKQIKNAGDIDTAIQERKPLPSFEEFVPFKEQFRNDAS
jgi:hypothetical protein